MKKNGGDKMDALKILVVDDEKAGKGFLDNEEFPGTGSR